MLCGPLRFSQKKHLSERGRHAPLILPLFASLLSLFAHLHEGEEDWW